jgi:hypothetical protein
MIVKMTQTSLSRPSRFLSYGCSPIPDHAKSHVPVPAGSHSGKPLASRHPSVAPSGRARPSRVARISALAENADHHTLVLVGALEDRYEHSAYEVVDLDALGQGQQVLRAAGWRHLWGIRRHVLGSQLFDYARRAPGAGDRAARARSRTCAGDLRAAIPLPRRELPQPREGVGASGERLSLQHAVQQGGLVHRARGRAGGAAGAREPAGLRDRAGPGAAARPVGRHRRRVS